MHRPPVHMYKGFISFEPHTHIFYHVTNITSNVMCNLQDNFYNQRRKRKNLFQLFAPS